jgi:hypothetical protein
MGAQPQPANNPPDPQTLHERLSRLGVVITPATARPDTPIRQPLRIPGVSLSETVVQMRREDPEA